MNDLISRQAAIDAVEKESQIDGAYGYMDTKSIVDLLCELPSAQPERKKGKWIVVDDGCISGKCSVCGWAAHMYEDDVMGMDYCPNCGARLEGEG